jgi:hypothetical protein
VASELDPGVAVAYQDVTLAELRRLFDQVDFDLRDVLERELEVSRELDELTLALDALHSKLRAKGGVKASDTAPEAGSDAPRSDATSARPRYDVPVAPALDDFGLITTLAKVRLAQLGVDLDRDPLLQVLPSSQIAKSLEHYADTYGETGWDETDWAVVLAAGFVATVLDIVLVRIPQDSTYLGKQYAGSPLTKWLQDKERARAIHERFFEQLEAKAHVPFDAPTTAATDGRVIGMRPATHRLQSFGHDPLLGFLVGMADLMHGTGTYVDKAGKIVQVATVADPVDLATAMLTQVRHLLSDVSTPMGLPPPLFSLLQVGQVRSPFALGPSGVKVPWTDVARYMYVHGYDLRHFFVSGIVPGVVKATITGYWLLDGLATRGLHADRTGDRAKLASMLLVGHTIATSGNLLKTGLVFGMNPLALNWAQLLAMAPAILAWIAESVRRETMISRGLDEEWQRLLKESDGLLQEVQDQPTR